MAKQSNATRWTLFIDESGDFESPSSHVILAGVAVAAQRDPILSARMRAAVRRAAPLVPWPLHRWLATKEVAYPFWFEQNPDAAQSEVFADACRRALEVWEAKDISLLNAVRSGLATGSEPTPKQLRRLKKLLKKHAPLALDILSVHAQSICMAVSHAFQAVLRDASGPEHQVATMGFIAGESDRGDAITDGSGERYFNLLVCMFERVLDAMARLPGEHIIDLNLATRWAKHPDLPESSKPRQGRRLSMNRDYVVRASEVALASRTRDELQLPVRFSFAKIWTYDAQVAPGIVLADSVANYLRTCAVGIPKKSADGELDYLHQCARGYFGIPLQAGAPKLSNMSATGRARRAISRARTIANITLLDAGDLSHAWAAEQANQWIQFWGSGEETA